MGRHVQGCMNNLTFGDENMGYYETIAGGAGAGPHWHGRSGVHTHMTNTCARNPYAIVGLDKYVYQSQLLVFLDVISCVNSYLSFFILHARYTICWYVFVSEQGCKESHHRGWMNRPVHLNGDLLRGHMKMEDHTKVTLLSYI